jgi:hypothetical protein
MTVFKKYESQKRESEDDGVTKSYRLSSQADADRFDELFKRSNLRTRGVFFMFLLDCAELHLHELE